MWLGNWGSLRTVTVGLFRRSVACLFVKTTVPSTQIPFSFKDGEESIICFILAAFRFTCWLGLLLKLGLPALCHTSPWHVISPFQFFVSKTKTPFGPKTMWSMSPPLLRRCMSFKRRYSSLRLRLSSLLTCCSPAQPPL